MSNPVKQALIRAMPAIDVIIFPVVYLCALLLKYVRTVGVDRLPASRAMLLRAGCFPLRDHYYEPSSTTQPYGN